MNYGVRENSLKEVEKNPFRPPESQRKKNSKKTQEEKGILLVS